MNKEEDRVLHGLWFWRQMMHEHIPITGDEVLWLAQTPFKEHKQAKFGTLDRSQRPGETRFRAFTASQQRPLDYLQSKGLIRIIQPGSNMNILELTGQGVERGRRLHTWHGRVDLWYRDRKEGIVGLWVPALVAIVVSVLANWIIYKFRE